MAARQTVGASTTRKQGIMYVAVLIARLVGFYSAVKSQLNLGATSLNTDSARIKEQCI